MALLLGLLAIPVVYWQRLEAEEKARKEARARELALRQQEAQKLKEIVFRKQGERGLQNASYGDIMCADGVYLPLVMESGFAVSMDGRWIRVSSVGQASAYLVDRKTRHSWILSAEEAEMLETIHWRLPRWSGQETSGAGMHEHNEGALSDSLFHSWLGSNVTNAATPLTAVRDLWVPWNAVPTEKDEEPPQLPQPPNAGLVVSVQRYWPDSLRTEHQPLEILTHPQWQLLFDGQPQPWVVALEMPFEWRQDGQALAMYAYSLSQNGRQQRLTLAVWEAERGWQKWTDAQPPEERKPWQLKPVPKAAEGSASPSLRWMKSRLMQRMRIDTPLLQRQRLGTRITPSYEPVLVPATHQEDGRLVQGISPVTHLTWERNLQRPEQWLAYSEPMAGHALRWSLALSSAEVASGMPAYRLHWGQNPMPGLWELEHIIVRQRWAILLRHPQDDGLEDGTQVYVWDGRDLVALAVEWPIERIAPVPSGQEPGQQAIRARLLAARATVDIDAADLQTGAWRWPLHHVTPERCEMANNAMVYEVHDIVPDAQGVWQLLPNWRPIDKVQHPCSDGDYFWSGNVRDELWWWGGMRQYTPEHHEDDGQVPRTEGVTVTRSGLVLCGTGPSAMPHPNGEGWLVLQCPKRPAHGTVSTWHLHWLQPHNRQIRTLMLQAAMPLLEGWDNRGVYWREEVPPAPPAEEGQPEQPIQRPPIQTVESDLWQRAEIHDLKQGPYGLWLRKQDMGHADIVRNHPDWPWSTR